MSTKDHPSLHWHRANDSGPVESRVCLGCAGYTDGVKFTEHQFEVLIALKNGLGTTGNAFKTSDYLELRDMGLLKLFDNHGSKQWKLSKLGEQVMASKPKKYFCSDVKREIAPDHDSDGAVWGGALDDKIPDLRDDMVFLIDELFNVKKERDAVVAMLDEKRFESVSETLGIERGRRLESVRALYDIRTELGRMTKIAASQRNLLVDALEALEAMQRSGVMMRSVLPRIRDYLKEGS